MALEQSVLDFDKITEILKSDYGYTLLEMHQLSFGSANCFKTICIEGIFFLKEYQSEITLDEVQCEAKLVEFLVEKDFPVARFHRTLDGTPCIVYKGHVISVQDYIEGKTYMNDMPTQFLTQEAKYLGLLHKLLKGYPMKKSMQEKWVETSDEAIGKYDMLLASLEMQKDDPNYQRIKDDLNFKKDLISKISDFKEYYKGITYIPSHGDYTACQLIFDDKGVKAVIDFSAATELPAVWEIMRSFIQSYGACKNDNPFPIEDFVLYVNEYRKYSPLTERDLRAIPYVYLLQLARSGYGYKEYLVTKTENRDKLLDFAFWRTDICREIYRNTEIISNALSENKRM